MIFQLTGTVTAHDGPYWEVDCPDAPPYLRPLFLTSVAGAQVGDRVLLAYHTTSTSGLWYAVRNLSATESV